MTPGERRNGNIKVHHQSQAKKRKMNNQQKKEEPSADNTVLDSTPPSPSPRHYKSCLQLVIVISVALTAFSYKGIYFFLLSHTHLSMLYRAHSRSSWLQSQLGNGASNKGKASIRRCKPSN